MKIKTLFAFLFLMAGFDTLLIYLCPVDFSFRSMSFVPHTAFLALLLLVNDKEPLDRILICLFAGIVYDFCFNSSFPISTLLFPLFGYILGALPKAIRDNVVTFFISCVLCIFLVDLLPFLFYKAIGVIQVRFWTWIFHVELTTLIFHVAVLIGLYFLVGYMEDAAMRRQQKRNEQERDMYRRIRSAGR